MVTADPIVGMISVTFSSYHAMLVTSFIYYLLLNIRLKNVQKNVHHIEEEVAGRPYFLHRGGKLQKIGPRK
jgi:hypothetical protein